MANKDIQSMKEAYDEVREGFKEFPKNKVQDKAATKPNTPKGVKQAYKMNVARAAHTDPDLKGIAQDAVKSAEKENKLTGKKKALGRAYDNSGEKADDSKVALKKKTLEAAFKKDAKGYPSIEEEILADLGDFLLS